MTEAFGQVLRDAAPRRPRRLQTDKGKEFFNAQFAALMRRHAIEHFASDSDQKAAVAERFNRTIKTRLWTYLSDRGTSRWIDAIQALVGSYNQSKHRTIGMAPADVRAEDEDRLWARIYGDGDTQLKPAARLARGDMVRINKSKGVFDKGYLPNWSKEHFTVSDEPAARRGMKRRVYKIEDYNGEPVKGVWYPEEIQKISRNQYRIEKVLRRRRAAPGGGEELFVKWEGWPEKFNSWINAADRYNVAAAE